MAENIDEKSNERSEDGKVTEIVIDPPFVNPGNEVVDYVIDPPLVPSDSFQAYIKVSGVYFQSEYWLG